MLYMPLKNRQGGYIQPVHSIAAAAAGHTATDNMAAAADNPAAGPAAVAAENSAAAAGCTAAADPAAAYYIHPLYVPPFVVLYINNYYV